MHNSDSRNSRVCCHWQVAPRMPIFLSNSAPLLFSSGLLWFVASANASRVSGCNVTKSSDKTFLLRSHGFSRPPALTSQTDSHTHSIYTCLQSQLNFTDSSSLPWMMLDTKFSVGLFIYLKRLLETITILLWPCCGVHDMADCVYGHIHILADHHASS